MNSLRYIFCKPEIVDGIEIHPIKMYEYEEFMNYANILTVSYDHFDMDEVRKLFPNHDFKLLELVLLFYVHPNQHDMLADIFVKLFTFVTHDEVFYDKESMSFHVGNKGLIIDKNNYDEIRKIILRQNLIFVKPVYKNPLMQEWFDLALETKAQSALKVSNESMITTIAAFNGMDLNLLETYSYFQISALFYRIMKIKGYDTSVLFKTIDGKIPIDHFAEDIDLFKNPYDDLKMSSSSVDSLLK